VFYQNLTGNMGDGWRDQHEAGRVYGDFVEEALTKHLTATYPDAAIEVRVETQRASGYSRWLAVVAAEMSASEEAALQESLSYLVQELWGRFCTSDEGEALYATD